MSRIRKPVTDEQIADERSIEAQALLHELEQHDAWERRLAGGYVPTLLDESLIDLACGRVGDATRRIELALRALAEWRKRDARENANHAAFREVIVR